MVHLHAMAYSLKLNQESLVEVSCCIFLLVGSLSSLPLKIELLFFTTRSKDFMQSRGLLNLLFYLAFVVNLILSISLMNERQLQDIVQLRQMLPIFLHELHEGFLMFLAN